MLIHGYVGLVSGLAHNIKINLLFGDVKRSYVHQRNNIIRFAFSLQYYNTFNFSMNIKELPAVII